MSGMRLVVRTFPGYRRSRRGWVLARMSWALWGRQNKSSVFNEKLRIWGRDLFDRLSFFGGMDVIMNMAYVHV